MAENLLRQLPQVDKLLKWPGMRQAALEAPISLVTDALRSVVEGLRHDILASHITAENADLRLSQEEIERQFFAELCRRQRSSYRRVLNATGVILHTGLGRAVLPEAAREALAEHLRGSSLVEVDPATGERNEREAAVVDLCRHLTGAEAGTVVNNNAAATLLILAALARDREVIVSRGQLVEIGGSFRIPDILRESGARLVEVGTTNRTYVRDYREAVSPSTAMLLQVHTSNYAIRGFAREVELEELVALGAKKGVAVVSDLGSGCFVDLSSYGFAREPLVAHRVQSGADLVCFSGDKLLGGPQAGIILGREASVRRVRAHPLFRALRVDKMTLVSLEATLRLYRDPDTLVHSSPALRSIMASTDLVRRRAEQTHAKLQERRPVVSSTVVPSTAQAGSGALPDQEIPSYALAITHPRSSSQELARALRLGEPPIFARIHNDRVLLDFRTILPGEEEELVAGLCAAG